MPVDPARAKALFLAASDLSAADRAVFLDRECGADADLRVRVEALLRADEGSPPAGATGESDSDTCTSAREPVPPGASNTFSLGDHDPGPVPPSDSPLDSETVPSAAPPDIGDYAPPAALGTVIAGRYTLVERIGVGGMGEVYRASQSEPVKRQVALKLIKSGMDSKAVLARFDAERQALALMDHPNIARIYDGGLTPTGQPFFVMELVTGVPLTDYCDTHRLTVDSRLRLFVQVCQAVQHAHQKGIIHRDLKPGNVLVTEVDGRPTPKVIDFGVAKATEQALTDLSLVEAGAVVGTPAYMSPEQADPTALDIDTRSDVYALGVMLYELLAGSPPIDASRFRRGALLEVLRMVREVEPPRPSAKLSTADALPNIAASRSIDPTKLAKLLRGELDCVVMKALEKDRTRRYESANSFARDIQRYLADELVEARQPSAGYRLKKFIRRHKGQVLAGSLVLLTLVAGVVVSVHFAVMAGAEATAARKAEGEARTAETDARSAETKAESEGRAARKAEADARWQARLANDARHAIQIDLALRARDEWDYDRVAALLQEMHPEYQDAWETRYVRTLWRREHPLRVALKGSTKPVASVAFSPDGTRVLTGSSDDTARLWDTQTGQEKFVLRGHTNTVTSVAFSPDGTRILTNSQDKTARVWDAQTGQQRVEFKHAGGIIDAVFSLDGKRVVTACNDHTARVWDAATGQEKVAFKGHTKPVKSVAFSPDGTRVVTGSEDGTARLWDDQTGQEMLVLRGHAGAVIGVAFSPDGARVLTGSWDGTTRVWDAQTGHEDAVLKGHTNIVSSVAFSPDGTRILTGSWDGTARLWDAQTGQQKSILKGHTGKVTGMAFSPDGTRILTGSNDGTARLWGVQTGQQMIVLKRHASEITDGAFRSDDMRVAFSPDGMRIVTGDGNHTALLWDAETGQEPPLTVAPPPREKK